MIGLIHIYYQASLRTNEYVRARKVSAGVMKEPNFLIHQQHCSWNLISHIKTRQIREFNKSLNFDVPSR